MKKIAVCTGFHKRPRIFELFLQNFINYSSVNHYEFFLCLSGSREDSESFRVLETSGIPYLFSEIPNEPLGKKMNAAIRLAEQTSFDYVLSTGFDDLFSPEVFDQYKKYTDQSVDYIGLRDIYFLNFLTGKGLFWSGYEGEREGETVGAGRMFSRRLIELLDYRLWNDERSSSLDKSLTGKLQGIEHTTAVFSCRDTPVMDIKNGDNIWGFEALSGQDVDLETILEKMNIRLHG